ncbi:hypothetical protein HJ177_23450 [Vibrio parahaemolyticus]|nr:hypothetical protein [Vibrio parahaemolyticus]
MLDKILERAKRTKQQVDLEATFETDEAVERMNKIDPIPRKPWMDHIKKRTLARTRWQMCYL